MNCSINTQTLTINEEKKIISALNLSKKCVCVCVCVFVEANTVANIKSCSISISVTSTVKVHLCVAPERNCFLKYHTVTDFLL